MTVIMNEIPWDGYKDLNEIFGAELQHLREKYIHNSFGIAEEIKNNMNASGWLAEILTVNNGNMLSDKPLKVGNEECMYYSVVLMGEWIIDALHTDKIIKTSDYLRELQKNNPKLQIYPMLNTGWYDAEGYPYTPTIQELIDYRY